MMLGNVYELYVYTRKPLGGCFMFLGIFTRHHQHSRRALISYVKTASVRD